MLKAREKLIEECYKRSIELLRNNSTVYGVAASAISRRATQREYISIFGRDASICSLGMVISGDKKLISIARSSLLTLARWQAENGQIPNCVNPKKRYVNFWFMGCIDATLWWLIAVDFYSRHVDRGLGRRLRKKVDSALGWLRSQAHPLTGLLLQNEASDWADIFPRSGHVLYTNSLWYYIRQKYGVGDTEEVRRNFNKILFELDVKSFNLPMSEKPIMEKARISGRKNQFYFSFVNYLFWGSDLDVFGNSLAVLFGLPGKDRRNKIMDFISRQTRRHSLPMPVLFSPIRPNSRQWREYMDIHNQNFPGQYHNGGIWPYAACFWAMALASTGRRAEAERECERIAKANSVGNWEFNEWFHARTGEPSGMKHQSWNAGAFLLLYHYLYKNLKL